MWSSTVVPRRRADSGLPPAGLRSWRCWMSTLRRLLNRLLDTRSAEETAECRALMRLWAEREARASRLARRLIKEADYPGALRALDALGARNVRSRSSKPRSEAQLEAARENLKRARHRRRLKMERRRLAAGRCARCDQELQQRVC